MENIQFQIIRVVRAQRISATMCWDSSGRKSKEKNGISAVKVAWTSSSKCSPKANRWRATLWSRATTLPLVPLSWFIRVKTRIRYLFLHRQWLAAMRRRLMRMAMVSSLTYATQKLENHFDNSSSIKYYRKSSRWWLGGCRSSCAAKGDTATENSEFLAVRIRAENVQRRAFHHHLEWKRDVYYGTQTVISVWLIDGDSRHQCTEARQANASSMFGMQTVCSRGWRHIRWG